MIQWTHEIRSRLYRKQYKSIGSLVYWRRRVGQSELRQDEMYYERNARCKMLYVKRCTSSVDNTIVLIWGLCYCWWFHLPSPIKCKCIVCSCWVPDSTFPLSLSFTAICKLPWYTKCLLCICDKLQRLLTYLLLLTKRKLSVVDS